MLRPTVKFHAKVKVYVSVCFQSMFISEVGDVAADVILDSERSNAFAFHKIGTY